MTLVQVKLSAAKGEEPGKATVEASMLLMQESAGQVVRGNAMLLLSVVPPKHTAGDGSNTSAESIPELGLGRSCSQASARLILATNSLKSVHCLSRISANSSVAHNVQDNHAPPRSDSREYTWDRTVAWKQVGRDVSASVWRKCSRRAEVKGSCTQRKETVIFTTAF